MGFGAFAGGMAQGLQSGMQMGAQFKNMQQREAFNEWMRKFLEERYPRQPSTAEADGNTAAGMQAAGGAAPPGFPEGASPNEGAAAARAMTDEEMMRSGANGFGVSVGGPFGG